MNTDLRNKIKEAEAEKSEFGIAICCAALAIVIFIVTGEILFNLL